MTYGASLDCGSSMYLYPPGAKTGDGPPYWVLDRVRPGGEGPVVAAAHRIVGAGHQGVRRGAAEFMLPPKANQVDQKTDTTFACRRVGQFNWLNGMLMRSVPAFNFAACPAGCRGPGRAALAARYKEGCCRPTARLAPVVAAVGIARPGPSPPTGRESFGLALVCEAAQGKLLDVVLALHHPCRLPRRLHRRQQQRDQNADDRDDHQELDQRKTSSGSGTVTGGPNRSHAAPPANRCSCGLCSDRATRAAGTLLRPTTSLSKSTEKVNCPCGSIR